MRENARSKFRVRGFRPFAKGWRSFYVFTEDSRSILFFNRIRLERERAGVLGTDRGCPRRLGPKYRLPSASPRRRRRVAGESGYFDARSDKTATRRFGDARPRSVRELPKGKKKKKNGLAFW